MTKENAGQVYDNYQKDLIQWAMKNFGLDGSVNWASITEWDAIEAGGFIQGIQNSQKSELTEFWLKVLEVYMIRGYLSVDEKAVQKLLDRAEGANAHFFANATREQFKEWMSKAKEDKAEFERINKILASACNGTIAATGTNMSITDEKFQERKPIVEEALILAREKMAWGERSYNALSSWLDNGLATLTPRDRETESVLFDLAKKELKELPQNFRTEIEKGESGNYRHASSILKSELFEMVNDDLPEINKTGETQTQPQVPNQGEQVQPHPQNPNQAVEPKKEDKPAEPQKEEHQKNESQKDQPKEEKRVKRPRPRQLRLSLLRQLQLRSSMLRPQHLQVRLRLHPRQVRDR